MLFERFAIDVLMACKTVKGALGILRTSWDETWHILQKSVSRDKARKTDKVMPCSGIDEKSFRKGQSYITIIYDLDMSAVFVKSAKATFRSRRAKLFMTDFMS
jgi:transposase